MEEKVLWYLPNEQTLNADGPYTTEEIISKINKKELNSDSFVWGAHFFKPQWIRIYEVNDFISHLPKYPSCPIPKKRSRGSVQQVTRSVPFSSQQGEYGIENEYRRFPRAPFSCNVIIHNQKEHLECKSIDISEKGLSIQSENSSLFKIGEQVIITLLDTPYAGTISVHATIMRTLDNPFHGYGIYFLTLNPSLKNKIAQYVIESLGFSKEERKAA